MADGAVRRIVFCDSGVGGADLAAHFADALRHGAAVQKIEIILFNAWARPGLGFNQLPDLRKKKRALDAVLKGIARFAPDQVFFACNTLSTILAHAPELMANLPFPVAEMLIPSTRFLYRELAAAPGSAILLCGTATTVESRIYEMRLQAQGIAPERIFSLACPGLATQIEYAPSGAIVQAMLRRYARTAKRFFAAPPPKLLTALCCTHFGYAPMWEKEFSACFADVKILNPNRAAAEAVLPQWQGKYHPEISARFVTRVDFPETKARALMPCFAGRAPEIIDALFRPERDTRLFTF